MSLGGTTVYQYTALDDCTRMRVLRLCERLHVGSSLRFLTEVCGVLPFPIRKFQGNDTLRVRP